MEILEALNSFEKALAAHGENLERFVRYLDESIRRDQEIIIKLENMEK